MTALATPRHRVASATAQMRAAADSVTDASVWSMDAPEAAATMIELTRLRAQVDELTARVAAHVDDLHVGQEVGASSAANWLAHETKQTRPEANRTVRLGHLLDAHPQTRDALAAGDLVAEQARVILRWVDDLPDDIDPDLRTKAEAHLLDQARHHDAKALNRLGRRLFEVIAPDEADAREAKLLEAEEKAASRTCHLRVWDDGQGTTHVRGEIPTLYGAALTKALRALTSRRHLAATDGAGIGPKPTPEAMGQAFCEYISRFPRKKLPKTGGINATVVVTMTYEALVGDLEQAATLDTGEHISPGLARKLACQAGLRAAVLGADSEVLDLSRETRLFTEAQRIAMLIRDNGCLAEGCDRTTGLHAHHRKRWADGGESNLADAVSLCPWHHAKAHDTHYDTTYMPTGKVRFHRRT